MNNKHAVKNGGCLFSGPSRGDCLHYIGLSYIENKNTTNEYGRPYGWCQVCWLREKINRLEKALRLEKSLHLSVPNYSTQHLSTISLGDYTKSRS